MKSLSKFLDEFPDQWAVGGKEEFGIQAWKHHPKPTKGILERLNIMFGRELNLKRNRPLKKMLINFDREKVNQIVEKAFFLRLSAETFGEAETNRRFNKLRSWFKDLKNDLVESLPVDLKNDLFFGIGRMFSAHQAWQQMKIDEAQLKKDLRFYKKLNALRKRFPNDPKTWRKKWGEELEEMVKKFEANSAVLISPKVRPLKKNIYGIFNRKIPIINSEISHFLKDRLGECLKNQHDRQSIHIQRSSNDKRAAQLIIEGAQIFDIPLEDEDRLRKA